MSRQELCKALKRRPNTVGDQVAEMMGKRLLREGEPRPRRGRGRLHVPVEIDPDGVGVVGLALSPSEVCISRMNLLGEARDLPVTIRPGKRDPIATSERLLREHRGPGDLAIGLSTTGFVDPSTREVLRGSSIQRGQSRTGPKAVSLEPIYKSAGRRPVVVDNDMHALAACWTLTREPDPSEDLLLVQLEDGAVGAAMFVEGRPNRGCVISANELGHMRLPVKTPRCYCGQVGCIERICSTAYLKYCSRQGGTLRSRAERYAAGDKAMRRITRHIADVLANACNFVRPHRLVLTGSLIDHERFVGDLTSQVKKLLLPALVGRVEVACWQERPESPAEVAGWLALASIYNSRWR